MKYNPLEIQPLNRVEFLNELKDKSQIPDYFLLEYGLNKSKQVILASQGIDELDRAKRFVFQNIIHYFSHNEIPFYISDELPNNNQVLFNVSKKDHKRVASRFTSLINSQPFYTIDGMDYYPKISVGVTDIAGKPEHSLIRAHETYRKASLIEGGNISFMYSHEKEWQDSLDSLVLLPKINRIITSNSNSNLEDHLILHYQDIVPLLDETKEGPHFEILSRFHLSDGEIVYPDRLFRTLEQSKSSGHFDLKVFELAFEKLQELEKRSIEYSAAINVSEASVDAASNFFKHVDHFQDEKQITPENIWLEISEKCTTTLTPFVQLANERGYNISYDDYGQGGTNLEKLKKEVLGDKKNPNINPNRVKLKIDKEYIQELETGSSHSTYGLILLALRIAADYQGLQIVAEGIENKPLEDKLKKIHFDTKCSKHYVKYGQGFYYNKPQKLDSLIEEIIDKDPHSFLLDLHSFQLKI